MKITAFDWDKGNWPKCGKHGVSREEIEQIFLRTPVIFQDSHASEHRLRAIGKTEAGRYVFAAFVFRKIGGKKTIRPISARYMHKKEISNYENKT